MGIIKRVIVLVVFAALAGSAYALVQPGLLVGGSELPLWSLPEPADWMGLLCGLAVAAFIARRKTSEGFG